MNRNTVTYAVSALALAWSTIAVARQPVPVAIHIEPDGSQTMVHETLVAAPIADVWTAISTPQGG